MKSMKMYVAAALALVAFGPLSLAAADKAKKEDKKPPTILQWKSMSGIPRPYTGTLNPIRGVNGGGLPWIVGEAKGKLERNGHLEAEVTGLVFDPSDAGVLQNGLGNRNTVASFRAVVSCLSRDAAGVATLVNLSTDVVPATIGLASEGGGNARIEANLTLPKPCLAPIVFITSATGSWLAGTGF